MMTFFSTIRALAVLSIAFTTASATSYWQLQAIAQAKCKTNSAIQSALTSVCHQGAAAICSSELGIQDVTVTYGQTVTSVSTSVNTTTSTVTVSAVYTSYCGAPTTAANLERRTIEPPPASPTRRPCLSKFKVAAVKSQCACMKLKPSTVTVTPTPALTPVTTLTTTTTLSTSVVTETSYTSTFVPAPTSFYIYNVTSMTSGYTDGIRNFVALNGPYGSGYSDDPYVYDLQLPGGTDPSSGAALFNFDTITPSTMNWIAPPGTMTYDDPPVDLSGQAFSLSNVNYQGGVNSLYVAQPAAELYFCSIASGQCTLTCTDRDMYLFTAAGSNTYLSNLADSTAYEAYGVYETTFYALDVAGLS